MKFDDLKLSDPILRSLKDQDYKEPTPIQAEVIPAILNKSDIMAAAQTGTSTVNVLGELTSEEMAFFDEITRNPAYPQTSPERRSFQFHLTEQIHHGSRTSCSLIRGTRARLSQRAPARSRGGTVQACAHHRAV